MISVQIKMAQIKSPFGLPIGAVRHLRKYFAPVTAPLIRTAAIQTNIPQARMATKRWCEWSTRHLETETTTMPRTKPMIKQVVIKMSGPKSTFHLISSPFE